MLVFFEELLFFHSFAALYLASSSVSARTEGVVKQKADRLGQEERVVENLQKCKEILCG